MIARICRRLIQHADGLPTQRHKRALESQIPDPRFLLLPTTPIILDEQRDRRRRIPGRAAQRELKHIAAGYRFGNLKGLCRGEIRRRRKVQIGAVLEELDGPRCGPCRGGVDQEGVEFDLAGETVISSRSVRSS